MPLGARRCNGNCFVNPVDKGQPPRISNRHSQFKDLQCLKRQATQAGQTRRRIASPAQLAGPCGAFS